MQTSVYISKKGFYRDANVSERTGHIGITESLFFLYLLILPLESSDYLNFLIEFINVSAVDLLLIAVLYLAFIKKIASKSKFSLLPALFVYIFLLVILSSIISFFYLTWDESISYDVKMTLNLFEFLAIFYVTTSLVKNRVILNKTMLVLCMGLLIYSTLTILKSVGIALPGYERMSYLYVGPFYVGTVAIVNSVLPISLLILGTFPFVISGKVIERLWIRIPLILIYLLCTLLTYTRSLWIALIFQAALFLVISIHPRRNFVRKLLLVCCTIFIGFFLYLYFSEIYLFLEGIRPTTLYSRLHAYEIMADMLGSDLKLLFFGVGKGTFIHYFAWYSGEESVVHNFIFDILISKGLITLLLMLTLISIIVYDLYKINKTNNSYTNSYAIIFIISISGLIFEGMMSPITNSLIFWTYLALAYSFVLIERRRPRLSKSYT